MFVLHMFWMEHMEPRETQVWSRAFTAVSTQLCPAYPAPCARWSPCWDHRRHRVRPATTFHRPWRPWNGPCWGRWPMWWMRSRSSCRKSCSKRPCSCRCWDPFSNAVMPWSRTYIRNWLVLWNMIFIFPYTVLGIIIPTDFHIFQRGRYTTSQENSEWTNSECAEFGVLLDIQRAGVGQMFQPCGTAAAGLRFEYFRVLILFLSSSFWEQMHVSTMVMGLPSQLNCIFLFGPDGASWSNHWLNFPFWNMSISRVTFLFWLSNHLVHCELGDIPNSVTVVNFPATSLLHPYNTFMSNWPMIFTWIWIVMNISLNDIPKKDYCKPLCTPIISLIDYIGSWLMSPFAHLFLPVYVWTFAQQTDIIWVQEPMGFLNGSCIFLLKSKIVHSCVGSLQYCKNTHNII